MDTTNLLEFLAGSPDGSIVAKQLRGDMRPLADTQVAEWMIAHPGVLATLLAQRIDHHSYLAVVLCERVGPPMG